MQNSTPICVWRFLDAPEELREITFTGDKIEKWLIHVPAMIVETEVFGSWRVWVKSLDSDLNPTEIPLQNGGFLYVCY